MKHNVFFLIVTSLVLTFVSCTDYNTPDNISYIECTALLDASTGSVQQFVVNDTIYNLNYIAIGIINSNKMYLNNYDVNLLHQPENFRKSVFVVDYISNNNLEPCNGIIKIRCNSYNDYTVLNFLPFCRN